MGKQHQQPAGDRQVLLEMQELIAIAELACGTARAAATQKPASSSAAARV